MQSVGFEVPYRIPKAYFYLLHVSYDVYAKDLFTRLMSYVMQFISPGVLGWGKKSKISHSKKQLMTKAVYIIKAIR